MDRNTLIEKLNKEIAAGRVVTIAGTGVSVAVCGNQEFEGFKVATWTGLLLHGIKHCRDIGVADDDDVKLLTMQVESGKSNFLVSAAEEISQRMKRKSEGTFRGWLKDTVGGLTVRDRSLVDALVSLPGVLATLNYDHLLEHSTDKCRPVSWLKPDDVQDLLAHRVMDAVLHLHGSYHEPESVVLGLSSYLAVKDDAHAKAVLNLFAIDRTLLFVGCGDTLQDPNFARLIEWGKEALIDVSPRHYLLCRTSEVQDFRKKLVDTPWLQPLAYGGDYGELVPFLRSLVPAGGKIAAAPSRPSTHATFDLAAYQQAMRKRYGRLKLEELDPTTHDVRPLTLTGMFISQSARECAEFMPRVFELPKELQRRLREQGELAGSEMDEQLLTHHRRAYLDQSPQPILQIVRTPALRRLVILGDPGSGKSSLLQYLLLEWAEKAMPDIAAEPLPLLIELRAYARLRHEGKVDDFLGYLHEGASVRRHFDREQLNAWLKGNPSCILFDGLDEVFDPELRKEVSTAIHRFADEYPLVRVIVTSRIIGYQHQAWRDEDFRHFMLQELDQEQIADFLVRWHQAAYEDYTKAEAKRALLAEAIDHSLAIRQLAGNPLLLTMMAILNRTQDLPRDRAELYEQCARLLLHQWKVDTAFSTDPELTKASLDYKDKRSLLLSVARAMRSSEHGLAGNLIDEDTLEHTLTGGLKGVPNLRPDRAARALINQLRGRNFMLCSVGGRSYAFVHRTFLEYFCAVEIRECFQTEQSLTLDQLKTDIFGHWADETWHEVLSLLAGMVAPKFLREVLEWLLTQPDSTELCHHVFLAARCVGEVRRREELGSVEQEVFERIKALIRFGLRRFYSPWSDKTKATIGKRAVEIVALIWGKAADTRDWLIACTQTSEVWQVRYSAVEVLARDWADNVDTFPWLKACAQFDQHWAVRYSAVEALTEGWPGDPETLPIVKACAQTDEQAVVRQSALEALMREWRDAPEILPILKARMQFDDASDVRRSALEGLVRGWPGDPDILLWLKARVQSNEGWQVRQSAVEALTEGWPGDPETLAIVKACVQSDEDVGVRRLGVQALARDWRNAPETLPTVKACARPDQHWAVRIAGLEALVEGWPDDPETLPIVKTCVQTDVHEYVRRQALKVLAEGWPDDPETLPIVKTFAQTDMDGYVRQYAVEALVRGWRNDPETLPIVKTCAQTDMDGYVRQYAVEALVQGWRSDPETLPIIKTCVQADEAAEVRQRALEALVRGWKDAPETLAIVQDRVQADEDANVRQYAVEALVRGWRNDPETLPIVKTCAQTDMDENVRQCAVAALVWGWHDDPDTLPWLKAHLRSDEVVEVEQYALEALVWSWHNDPETLPIVKGCVQSAESAAVRQIAVEALVQGWRSDPETLPIIKTCVQADEAAEVRQRALEALVRGWKDAPETLAIVQDRVQADEDANVRQYAVEALVRGWCNDPETLPIIKTCVQADEAAEVRQRALEALVRGWKDAPETLAIVQDRVQADEDANVRQYAVEALVRGWRNDPETLPIVKTCVRTDMHEYVRRQALKVLAEGWPDDPETLPIVKTFAQTDMDGYVRQYAVEALMRGWRNDPETLPIVKTCVQTDVHEYVRRQTLKVLAEGWPDDPETLPIVKTFAQTDMDGYVRQYAVEALVRGWRNDPETLPIVKTCAQTDMDGYVRQYAVEALVQGWRSDPETLPIIKTCVQADEAAEVRQRALEALVRGWKDAPETLAIVQDRVQADMDGYVRQYAVEALVRGWRNDPETLPIVKTCAQTDMDENVSRVAVQALARHWPDDPTVQANINSFKHER